MLISVNFGNWTCKGREGTVWKFCFATRSALLQRGICIIIIPLRLFLLPARTALRAVQKRNFQFAPQKSPFVLRCESCLPLRAVISSAYSEQLKHACRNRVRYLYFFSPGCVEKNRLSLCYSSTFVRELRFRVSDSFAESSSRGRAGTGREVNAGARRERVECVKDRCATPQMFHYTIAFIIDVPLSVYTWSTCSERYPWVYFRPRVRSRGHCYAIVHPHTHILTHTHTYTP